MRSSTILAALSAALVAASPVHQALHARKIVTDIVTEIVYTTVTEGLLPTPALQVKTLVITSTVVVLPIEATYSTQPAPPPLPPPPASTHSTTAPAPVVVPPQTEVQAPAAPVPTTSKEAVVQAPASTAPASTAAAPAYTPTDYISAAIDHHNYHRSNHSASDISWSDDLAASALVVANSCIFAHNMDVDGGGYGQNLAAYGTSDTGSLDTASLVAWSITQEWYDGEYNAIPWGENSPSTSGPEFLHATQVIWKGSNEVGCATVQCAPGTIFGMTSWYTVCNYGPQGNVMGEFNSAISEGLGHPTVYATIS